MYSRLLIDANEIVAIIQVKIYQVTGNVDVRSNDYSDLVLEIVEDFLAVDVTDRTSIYQSFAEYGIDKDTVMEIMPYITLPIAKVLGPVINHTDRNIYYEYTLQPNNALIIDVKRLPEQTNPFDWSSEKFQQSIENGDFIPERVRRIHGY